MEGVVMLWYSTYIIGLTYANGKRKRVGGVEEEVPEFNKSGVTTST